MNPGSVYPDPRPRHLWQRALYRLADRANNVVWHPLDQAYAVHLLQALHAVGERPAYEEFKRYLQDVWPASPSIRKRVRGIWRKVLDDPHRRFRVPGVPSFGAIESICVELGHEYGDSPLAWRAAEVFEKAVDEYEAALDHPDLERYLAARYELHMAMKTRHRIRSAELGPAAVGDWGAMRTSGYTDDEAARWENLKRRYRYC